MALWCTHSRVMESGSNWITSRNVLVRPGNSTYASIIYDTKPKIRKGAMQTKFNHWNICKQVTADRKFVSRYI